MYYDNELVRRGVIVPVFKSKPPKNDLNFVFKGKRYFDYQKARSRVRALKLKNAAAWKKYCYLHTQLPYGVPESPEIVYRNKGWKSFTDWLRISVAIKTKIKRKKKKSKKTVLKKNKILNTVKNYRFSKLASKRLPKAKTAIKLIGNLSNTSSYKYNEEDVQKIFKSLSKAMKNLRKRFR